MQTQKTQTVEENMSLRRQIQHNYHRFRTFLKWILVAIVTGLFVGLVGIAFSYAMKYATNLRQNNPWLLYLLPLAGLAIVGWYHLLHIYQDKGEYQFA